MFLGGEVHICVLWPCNTKFSGGLRAHSDGAARNAAGLNQTGFQSFVFRGVCGIDT